MNLWNRLLVAVDFSAQSLSAVNYVAGVLGGSSNCQVLVLGVHRPPSPDSYPDDEERRLLDNKQRGELLDRLKEAKAILSRAGLDRTNVAAHLVEAVDATVGEVIMEHQKSGGFGTVVVGRRGLSKAEEFLFGSVSSAIVRSASNCTVWVVA